MIEAAIHLSPAAQRQLWRWIVRVLLWLGRWLGLPLWGAWLLTLGLLTAGGVVYMFWDRLTGWVTR